MIEGARVEPALQDGWKHKPRGARAYLPRIIADDLRGLIAALGEQRAHIVGHDLGAGAA